MPGIAAAVLSFQDSVEPVNDEDFRLYARMEEILRTLGFTLRGIEEKNKIYHHAATGAVAIFPEFPAENAVLPRHLLAVKSVLQAHGLADPVGFTTELHKAS